MRNRDDSQRLPHNEREGDLARNERDVEDKYLARLNEPRDDFAQQRLNDQATRLAAVIGSTSAEIREAWHLWRTKEPQPETHAHMDAMQVRLSDDKNLAFAALLARSGVERQPQTPDMRPSPPRDDDGNPFAAAARGAGFRRADGNWGDRPNFEAPQERKPEPQPEVQPLMRAAVSPLERQAIQAEALEAVARGALDAARNFHAGRPAILKQQDRPDDEGRRDYYARKRDDLDERQVKSVERDVQKLRMVPGLGDLKVAEREFEKADDRFRAASSDEERAKAFTRATALSIIIEGLARREQSARPLPVPSAERPDSVERDPPVVLPIRPGDSPVRPELVPTAPERHVVPLDPANLPTQRRDEDEDTTREERRVESDRDEERTDPQPQSLDRGPPTAPGRRRAAPQPQPEEHREPGTAPGRPRSMGKEHPQEQPASDSRESAPLHRIGREGLLVPLRTSDVDDRQIVEERSVSYSRSVERDAFSLRDRERQNSEDERLGQAIAHEMFCAQDFREADHIMEQVRAATERLRSDPVNADWREVARKHEVLADEALDRDDNDLHLPERIALAELAMDRLSSHHRLVHQITMDHIETLREAPPWERDAMKQEALVLLAIEARPGERPFEDWAFVGRELARVSDQGDDSVRVLSLINAFNRHAAPSLLAEDARWEPAMAERVRQQGDDLLREEPAVVDARLASELTSLRMTIVLDPDEGAREAARERAKEVALLAEDLPARRSLEIETA